MKEARATHETRERENGSRGRSPHHQAEGLSLSSQLTMLERVAEAVAAHFNLKHSELRSSHRREPAAHARMLAIYLVTEACPKMLDAQIGGYFRRCKASVTLCRQRVEELVQMQDRKTMGSLAVLRRELADRSNQREQSPEERSDQQRMDWIEAQSNDTPWLARQSTTGRGFRLHNTGNGYPSAREAIDAAMEASSLPSLSSVKLP